MCSGARRRFHRLIRNFHVAAISKLEISLDQVRLRRAFRGIGGEKELEAIAGLIDHEIGVPVGAADGFADQSLGTLHLLSQSGHRLPPEAESCRPHWPVAASVAGPGRAEQRSIASRPRWIGCKRRQGRSLLKALQKHLRGDLGAEAAGVGFAGGEGAVFPELVAAVAPATEPEVFAPLLAGVHAAGHVGHEPTELIGVGGFHQRQILEIAEVEAAVAVAGHRKQLRVEGGEIALPIHAEDRERAIQLVLGHPRIALDQADHLLEFAQHHGITVLLAQPPEGPQEVAVLLLHRGALHR